MIRYRIFLLLYRILVAPVGVILAFTLGTLLIPKVREGLRLRGRKVKWPEFEGAPIWIHASSGEFEYAKPLIRELKSRNHKQAIVVTYFSPSYAKFIEKFPGVDLAMPLPLDLPGPARSFLERLRPKIGFLARTDLWPEILFQAHDLGVPLFLFSVTKAKKPKLFDRFLQKWLLSYLKAVFCVDSADQINLTSVTSAVPSMAIGDTRFDQVRERLMNAKPLRDNLKPNRQTTIIAGSTWSQDEKAILDGLVEPLKSGRLRLCIAPHEPTASHLTDLARQLERHGLSHCLYSSAASFDTQVLIVDKVGILAELYQWGKIAFVGGSFRGSVHSVMEPLAAGCITIVGPHHLNNREALQFQEVGRGHMQFVRVAGSAGQLREIVEQTLASEDVSSHIRTEIESRCGATDKLIEYVQAQGLLL